MPLHTSLASNAPIDVIKMLLEAYPQAIEVQDIQGWLPLHYACTSEFYLGDSSLEVLSLVISAYPKGIDAKDSSGKLPSD